jgi:hypothetical protein
MASQDNWGLAFAPMEQRLHKWLDAYFKGGMPFNEFCAATSRVFANASTIGHMADLAGLICKRLCNEGVHTWDDQYSETQKRCINCGLKQNIQENACPDQVCTHEGGH